jgi:hypothetical protein
MRRRHAQRQKQLLPAKGLDRHSTDTLYQHGRENGMRNFTDAASQKQYLVRGEFLRSTRRECDGSRKER